MTTVNMLEAKTNLSKLVEAVETGREAEIVIARNGRPVARILPIRASISANRIGVAKGRFVMPEAIDGHDPEIEKLFSGKSK